MIQYLYTDVVLLRENTELIFFGIVFSFFGSMQICIKIIGCLYWFRGSKWKCENEINTYSSVQNVKYKLISWYMSAIEYFKEGKFFAWSSRWNLMQKLEITKKKLHGNLENLLCLAWNYSNTPRCSSIISRLFWVALHFCIWYTFEITFIRISWKK